MKGSTAIDLIKENHGELCVSSLDVARQYKKSHKDVLRSIRQVIDISGPFGGRNFAPSNYLNSRGKIYLSYDITEEGLMLLMGEFIGEKARETRLLFANAFQDMKTKLRRVQDELLPEVEKIKASYKKIEKDLKIANSKLTAIDEQRQKRQSRTKSKYIWVHIYKTNQDIFGKIHTYFVGRQRKLRTDATLEEINRYEVRIRSAVSKGIQDKQDKALNPLKYDPRQGLIVLRKTFDS